VALVFIALGTRAAKVLGKVSLLEGVAFFAQRFQDVQPVRIIG
jgi:hypothetical protein